MSLNSMDKMILLNEVQMLRGKLNLASELIKEIRYELVAEKIVNCEYGINWEKIDEIRDYTADLSDFLITK